ncbi:biotin/lipoate A/B protein ligase family protein [Rhodococcus coprophilus]|uniref:Biotin/lipoate a/b protein ligase n=1 Tax=Rhodococcus coprophilus TaxID=38310 RepID=A0A2X4TMW3_9NOCA|nr:biotin/lipoate A/B protein ligase family protein [Rhodococcus coprophilus]MBM7460942.1 lipoate-protein ligase A [Rhodococcus coprophilus]SQI28746.1 biotin/lipoate a/b protein ligase [Rhodococcus coprophilus]
MRGEYKVPDGKLVAVDVEVEDEQLAKVSLFGDFFLEPDEALEDIVAAVTGMPTTASADTLGKAIADALDDDVSMIGFTPESVGIAIRRALGHATTWHDHTFDVIEPVSLDPALHVALDEVITREVASGNRPPTLRFWDWNAPLVVLGSFQSVRNEVDEEAAARHGIGVVRRISGGGAMFMEPGNCITYSLSVPTSLVDGLSFERSYAFLDQWVMGALADVGIKARYVPLNDIASEHGKIAGAAQKRFAAGAVLHHVTMAYDIDVDKMTDVLRIGREKISDKGITSSGKRVDPMRSQTGMTRDDIIAAFLTHFRTHYNTHTSAYTDTELTAARDLVDTKFTNPEWTYRVP